MEEREALKRQIDLLQSLINKHKSVHGDTPFTRVEQRRPEGSTSARGRGHSFRGETYAPQSRGSWRKAYSLKNNNPEPSVGQPFTLSSSSQGLSHSTALPSNSRGEDVDGTKAATLSPGITQQKKEGHMSSVTGIKEFATEEKGVHTFRKTAVSQHESGQKGSSSTGKCVEKKASSSSEAASVKANTSTSLQNSFQQSIKPSLTSKTSTEVKHAVTAGPTTAQHAALSKVSKQSRINLPISQTSQAQVGAPFLKKSKFTWVKNQSTGGGEPRQDGSVSSTTGKVVTVASKSDSKGEIPCRGSPSPALSKRTPAKKLPRKLSPVIAAPKTSKYKWISAGAQAKTSRKPLSPKALTVAQRALEKGEVTKKLKPGSATPAKLKKGTVGSSTSPSPSSRYRWKAGGQRTTAAVAGGAAVARRRSAFHWTSEKSNKGVRGGLVVSPTLPQRASFPSSSPGGFKLRSRMKIIRRSTSSGSGSEKGSSPSAGKHSPRTRIHTLPRTPIGVRRTPSKELVSIGRHKLRRLSPTSSRTSPASQRVFRTRYKMVTRPGLSVTHTLHYNPALSWRAKRIQSARSFLQSRHRALHDRHSSSTQHWRGTGMCWIGGSLYRVSANKLSRTVASNMSINRTGRSFSSAHVSPGISALNRPSSTRHLASRAVQRSLAIIRHARQKKQQRQYCMYYNRFGKCNRGSSCPYVHDPDKVAVCTRFLRGTCKQADGTCPFSHKVAKEKMPVCSYFLKGICNNSDCPYSHVYVSRKAEVCEAFVKGYCPEGAKCKKKHTLVCPDFSKTGSCPRGSRCKLQHRQRAKQSADSVTTAAKRARAKEASKRPRLSVVIPQSSQAAPGSPTAGSLELPSFISLSSSPEEADAPDTLPADTSQVKEKKLQIKPRL
ncbi:hypothetical protein PAMA_001026 [Pampus argenteus]